MQIAVAVWNQRVAPVFDNAREIVLAEVAGSRIRTVRQELLAGELPVQKVLRLAELRVETLICGAVSRPVLAMVAGYGIRVVPYVAGEPAAVIQAWARGALESERFRMPGCRHRDGRWFHERRTAPKEGFSMNSDQQGRRAAFGGRGQGGGRGPGGGGRGMGGRGGGRRPGPAAGGSAALSNDVCVCPQCGQRQPHERGVPCVAQKCPQCGAAMTRG